MSSEERTTSAGHDLAANLYSHTGATRYERAADPDRVAREAQYVAEYARVGQPPYRVLDVGCGTGQLDRYLDAQGIEVVGVDLAEEMLVVARELAPKIMFVNGDAGQLGSLGIEGPFQVVFGSGGVMHFLEEDSEVAAFFAGAEKLLAPGGTLILEVLDFESMSPDWCPMFKGDGLMSHTFWRAGIGRGGTTVTVVVSRDTNTGEVVMSARPNFNTNPGDLIDAARQAGFQLVASPRWGEPTDKTPRFNMLALTFQRT